MEDKYVLKVRNPRGVRKEKIQGLTAPRISAQLKIVLRRNCRLMNRIKTKRNK